MILDAPKEVMTWFRKWVANAKSTAATRTITDGMEVTKNPPYVAKETIASICSEYYKANTLEGCKRLVLTSLSYGYCYTIS